jgi:hypothetical protein
MRLGSKLPTRRYGIEVRRDVIKIGPNEPCPCGSGRKYKRCCGEATGLLGWWRRYRALQSKKRSLR